jgi:hypothetical protein
MPLVNSGERMIRANGVDGHGEALAREIPGAQLLPMEQTGHGLPRAAWNHVVPAILRHTAGEAA